MKAEKYPPLEENEFTLDESPTTKVSVFETLYGIDVSPYTEQMPGAHGKTLDYIEWATAWRVVKLIYPDASYQVHEFDEAESTNKVPYLFTKAGFFVVVSVMIEGATETEIYSIDVPDAEINAFVIANAHQRALVKALGRHGFGLCLWEKKGRAALHKTPQKPPSVSRETSPTVNYIPAATGSSVNSQSTINEEKITPKQMNELQDVKKKAGWSNVQFRTYLKGKGYMHEIEIPPSKYEEFKNGIL